MQGYENKSALPYSHDIKNEEIRDAILQDKNMLKSQNI